jgi:hypothetical protein
MRTRQAFDALDERTRVQRIRSMALSGIQGKPTGPLALKAAAKRYRIISYAKGGGSAAKVIHLARSVHLQKLDRSAS